MNDDDRAWQEHLGPAHTPAQVARMLGITEDELTARTDLLALRQRDGRTVYPAWQLHDGRPVVGLADVLQVLRPAVATPWTIASWLAQPLADLDDQRPIDTLHTDPDRVITLARRWAAALRR